MEVDHVASDSENVAVDDNKKPVVDEGAGDASTSHSERPKRKNKKYGRSNSKEGASPVAPLPKYRSWKNSRRPRSGHGRGLPKKGGAGGKGVWGVPGSELLEEYIEDQNDPNYDPEAITNGDIEFKQVIIEADPEEVIRKSEPVILEYFENGDTLAAADEFLEFVTAKRSHLVCETIVEIALDHKPSHCELASVLISDLYGRIFTAKDIGHAFERLLEKMPDLVLDTPEAVVMMSNFIARCVADDCLPPKFVQTQAEKYAGDHPNQTARQAIHRAETLLSMKQGLVRLDSIWGVGGGIRPVEFLSRQMRLLVKEYINSGDLTEAIRCVRELEVPHFHHELVYEAVLIAVESLNCSAEEQISTFLGELWRSGIVSPDQMDRGFLRVLGDMSDVVIDVPLAHITLDRFMDRCQQKFRLGEAVLKQMPPRGRKRFVSEGDKAIIKDHALKLRE